VLFQDLDVTWTKDPIPYLRELSQEYETLWMDDGARTNRFGPYHANTGFFYLRKAYSLLIASLCLSLVPCQHRLLLPQEQLLLLLRITTTSTNTGFFYLRNNYRTVQFWDTVVYLAGYAYSYR
jgi:hypothetical protein